MYVNVLIKFEMFVWVFCDEGLSGVVKLLIFMWDLWGWVEFVSVGFFKVYE